ncbi:MAG: hypothetical protein K9L59_02670 [Desulfobacterales bacterium]|nr:hypothetical protein [Desulfobacterales bacterium]
MAPAVSVRVCDVYQNGTGAMKAALFSMVPLADVSGGEEIDQREYDLKFSTFGFRPRVAKWAI